MVTLFFNDFCLQIDGNKIAVITAAAASQLMAVDDKTALYFFNWFASLNVGEDKLLDLIGLLLRKKLGLRRDQILKLFDDEINDGDYKV